MSYYFSHFLSHFSLRNKGEKQLWLMMALDFFQQILSQGYRCQVTKNHGHILVSLKSLLLTYNILTKYKVTWVLKTFREIIVQQCLGYFAEIKVSGSSVFLVLLISSLVFKGILYFFFLQSSVKGFGGKKKVIDTTPSSWPVIPPAGYWMCVRLDCCQRKWTLFSYG